MLDKMGLLRAVALLMAAQQGVIDLTDEDKALICKGFRESCAEERGIGTPYFLKNQYGES